MTLGSHDICSNRDMRDAGGALGPVDGVNPELHNLTCSMTFVDESDIVFITSDGVSDNFDPVVGKFCMINEENKENKASKHKKSTDEGNNDFSCATKSAGASPVNEKAPAVVNIGKKAAACQSTGALNNGRSKWLRTAQVTSSLGYIMKH